MQLKGGKVEAKQKFFHFFGSYYNIADIASHLYSYARVIAWYINFAFYFVRFYMKLAIGIKN